MSVESYNKQVRQWGGSTKRKLKLKYLQLVVKVGPGSENQKVDVKNYAGEASKINFAFPYYLVFVHKGAGRGYGGSKSGLFTQKGGGKGKTNRNSFGKMGTGKRVAKPWFNPVLEDQFPELANIVSAYHGDKVVLKLQKILIK